MVVTNIIRTILEQSFQYGVLSLGVYLTYSILDFPDLSVDGTMPLGGIVSAVLIFNGVNAWLSILAVFIVGCLAGSLTGLIHVKLKISPLLSGILMFTALTTVNLVICLKGGTGTSSVAIFTKPTIFSSIPAKFIPLKIENIPVRNFIVLLIFIILIKVLIDIYLTTKSGMLLRATGNNQRFVTMLAKNAGLMKILGLALGNGLAAVSGALVAQSTGSASTSMGTGMVVSGLSCVIIGLSVFGKIRFMKPTTMVIIGTIIYKACLQLAITFKLPSEYNKLLMAVLFIGAIILSRVTGTKGRSSKNVKA